jgi:hypothetical protein
MTRSRLASGVLVSAVVSGVLVGLPGVSARAATGDCPTAFPTAEAVDGVTGTGYTVERGTTADAFTAKIIGRIDDGIAPGIDMIMADLSSPALTRAGGVWAGMSGSPVYTPDGRLIGSVSYGLASSSPIAGITPAAEMKKLLSATTANPTAKTQIKVPASAARRIARTGAVTAAAAQTAGFHQLLLPVSISGASRNSTKFLKKMTASANVQIRTNGSRIKAAESAPSEIFPGSNFAAALSYGDVSIAGVGTTTFVCDGQAVAFGHPFFALGNVEYTAHPATSVYVQKDPVWGPFKVANPGGPVGVIDRDRLTGLHTELGARPTGAFPITTSLVPDGEAPVTGTTTGVYQPYAPDLAALHLQANIVKALGAEAQGSAALTFTINGTAGGTPFTLVRSDHYTDTYDISYTAADDLWSTMQPLVDQEFKQVKITSVNITGTVDSTIKQYRVTALKMYKNGKWIPQKGSIATKAGATVYRQLTLTKYRSNQTVIAKLKVKIPAKTQGSSGTLTVSDGWAADISDSEPTSFSGLLKQIRKYPTNDSVAGTLMLDNGDKPLVRITLVKTGAPVSAYTRDISLRVKD